MYNGKKIILIAPAYNEGAKIGAVVRRSPRNIIDKVLVVDDGSTDETPKIAASFGAEIYKMGSCVGVGAAIRQGYQIAMQENFDIAVVIAGNNKDSPEEIERLLEPITRNEADFVMGSRYLEGGRFGGDMPFYRKIATRLHPFLVGFFCGKKITESTNGYRAIKVEILKDPRIQLHQPWLNAYELEVYLLMKILKLRIRYKEVPVSKIYPPKKIGNTKMRPLVDWWKMLRPIFLWAWVLKNELGPLLRPT